MQACATVPANDICSREECEAQVSGVTLNIHRGYRSLQLAQGAFTYANTQGLTRSTNGATQAITYRINWAAPARWDYTGGSPISEGVSDDRWYVVYVGLKPGVFSTRCVSFFQLSALSGF